MAVAESHMRGSSWRELLGRARRPSPDAVALLVIVGIVLLANVPYLSGQFVENPLGRLSGIGVYSGLWDPNPVATTSATVPGVLPGVQNADPSNGPFSQALGHRAALDWIHLQVPWWNPYEGTGVPLAGEMASGALFPFTLLLLIGNGLLYELVLLQLLAGIATYFLLRRISVGRWASTAGGVAFALNGTFAVYAHAPVNPVAFLPLLLLGIEMAFAASKAARTGGWWLIAVSVALSIYGGFPETAYIDGLLAVFWFGWRCGCAGRQRLRAFATKAAVGAIVGVLLATPLLVAFATYAAHGDLGGHTGGYFGTVRIPHPGLPQLLLPYVYGPIEAFGDQKNVIATIWGTTGGYLSASLLLFGLLGLISPGRRGLRLLLLAWIVLAIARMYGEPPLLDHVLGVLPAMSNVAFFRYAAPSLELSVVVLAALGLDGVLANTIPRRQALGVTAAALLIVGAAAIGAMPLVHRILGPAHAHHVYSAGSVLWAAALIAAGGLVVFLPSSRARQLLAAAILCLDALVMFVIPELSAPRSIPIDTAPAAFLQRHLGLSRYYTLGPLGPNYGSYYGTRSLNADDWPMSSVFAGYIATRLDPAATPNTFNGTKVRPDDNPVQALESHLDGYRAAGVRYVLAPPSIKLPQGPTTFTLVMQTPTSSIYRLAGTEPYFTSTNPSCTVKPLGGTSVRLSCSEPTTLIRRETYMPGWSAQVDGHPTLVRKYDNAFQAVTVRQGAHLVTFGYTPPALGWAVAAFVLGCGWLLLPPLWARAGSKIPGRLGGSTGPSTEAQRPPVAT